MQAMQTKPNTVVCQLQYNTITNTSFFFYFNKLYNLQIWNSVFFLTKKGQKDQTFCDQSICHPTKDDERVWSAKIRCKWKIYY